MTLYHESLLWPDSFHPHSPTWERDISKSQLPVTPTPLTRLFYTTQFFYKKKKYTYITYV